MSSVEFNERPWGGLDKQATGLSWWLVCGAVAVSIALHFFCITFISWSTPGAPAHAVRGVEMVIEMEAAPASGAPSRSQVPAAPQTPVRKEKSDIPSRSEPKVQPKKTTVAPAKPQTNPAIDHPSENPLPTTSIAAPAPAPPLPTPPLAPATGQPDAPQFTPAISGLASLGNPAPAYPSSSLRNRSEGQVSLRIQVLPDGRAGTVQIVHSSGDEALDDAALETVRRWHFIPAKRGAVPIEGVAMQTINFKLPRR
ncbi:energy transducer TonB [Herbaspirillum camelliae]|uniref:energy transducer TonB n=1 Tax=Herbaspirillum camelliae TaxID=1892903 RepID=UPI000B17D5F3|nr:energy transducer TonB [Herbaspirillum camelliae]